MLTRRAFTGAVIASVQMRAAPVDLHWLTLEQAADLVRRKKVSPVELTRACLARVEELNKSVNAFITVTAEQALTGARALEAELVSGRYRGPLHGIPIALKDLIDTAGVRTTAASAHYSDRVPSEDAEVVRSLKAAGAVLIGKLNMDEFAYNFTSETSFFGAAHNPWQTSRSPGGSSGGSAIAVASGMCFAALGSDTGGSIRLPASLCGITGFKPTYGRVSTRGVAPLAWSLDHVGPMTRTARDAALIMTAIAPPAATGAPGRSLKQIRLGVPDTPYFNGLAPTVKESIQQAAQVLSRLTGGIQDISLPALPEFPAFPGLPLTYGTIITAEAYAFHEPMLKRAPDRYHAGTRRSIEGGAAVTAAAYIRARREMDQLRAESVRLFERASLIITPAAPGPAFELGSRQTLVWLRNLAPWNLYGLPAISIPCGFSGEGLPLGLQITGPAGRDDLVLALATAYQQVTDWHTRRPPG